MVLPAEASPRIPGTYSSAGAITPTDGVFFPATRAVYSAGTGLLIGTSADGSVVITYIYAGQILPLRMTAVAASGTTPGLGLVGLY